MINGNLHFIFFCIFNFWALELCRSKAQAGDRSSRSSSTSHNSSLHWSTKSVINGLACRTMRPFCTSRRLCPSYVWWRTPYVNPQLGRQLIKSQQYRPLIRRIKVRCVPVRCRQNSTLRDAAFQPERPGWQKSTQSRNKAQHIGLLLQRSNCFDLCHVS